MWTKIEKGGKMPTKDEAIDLWLFARITDCYLEIEPSGTVRYLQYRTISGGSCCTSIVIPSGITAYWMYPPQPPTE